MTIKERIASLKQRVQELDAVIEADRKKMEG